MFFWFFPSLLQALLLQSFHTREKQEKHHIDLLFTRNKMDSEEEKKEDKGEHINLKVKDQVRFSWCW